MLKSTAIGQFPIITRENMTEPGRMCIRHRVWVIKLNQDFSKSFVKPLEGKNEL
jgi:hypothetical protein